MAGRAGGQTTTTDSRSKRIRVSRRGGQVLTRARGPSNEERPARPAFAPGCPCPGRSHRTHQPGRQGTEAVRGQRAHLGPFIPATNLAVADRHRPRRLPQIPLTDLPRSIDGPLMRPELEEQRSDLAHVPIDDRLATIEPQRLDQLPDPDARQPWVPAQQLVNLLLERVELRRPPRATKLRRSIRPQRGADRVARQSRAPDQLLDRHPTNEMLPAQLGPALHVQHASSWHSINTIEPGSRSPRTPPPPPQVGSIFNRRRRVSFSPVPTPQLACRRPATHWKTEPSVQPAEREGFEPSMDETAHTGFRDRRIQPLCHLSGLQGEASESPVGRAIPPRTATGAPASAPPRPLTALLSAAGETAWWRSGRSRAAWRAAPGRSPRAGPDSAARRPAPRRRRAFASSRAGSTPAAQLPPRLRRGRRARRDRAATPGPGPPPVGRSGTRATAAG